MATIEKYETRAGTALYRVRYRTPDNRQTDKRGFTTKRDAQDFANTVEVSKLRGEFVPVSSGAVTVGQLGPLWLNRQRGHAKAASLRVYESAWLTNVAPRWSAVTIASVRRSDIQAWLADLGGHRGAETVRKAHRVLSAILADAVADRMLAANPAAGVKLPNRPPARHVYLSAEQLSALADEAGPYRPLVLLLGIGGLRWGEAAALRVSDVDWLRRRVQLTRNAVTVNGHAVVGTLKSGKDRSVPLPQFVTDALAVTAAGKGPRGPAVVHGSGRVSRTARAAVVAGVGGGAVPGCRPRVSACYRPRPTAHGRSPGDRRRRQRQGCPANARPAPP